MTERIEAGPVPRTPRGEVRRRVLRAAEEVFAEQGFARARVEHIAARAGFSKGAVYSNFATKDELFYALLEKRVAHREALARSSTAGGTARQQAGAAGRVLSRALADDPQWTVLLLAFWADSVNDPERRERLEAFRAPLRDEIAAVIAATAKRTGIRLALAPREAAVVAIALANGLAVEQLAGAEPPEDLLARVLPLILIAGDP